MGCTSYYIFSIKQWYFDTAIFPLISFFIWLIYIYIYILLFDELQNMPLQNPCCEPIIEGMTPKMKCQNMRFLVEGVNSNKRPPLDSQLVHFSWVCEAVRYVLCFILTIATKHLHAFNQGLWCHLFSQSTSCNHHGTNLQGTIFAFVIMKVRQGSSLFGNLSIWKSLYLSISWFRFYLMDLIVYILSRHLKFSMMWQSAYC